MAAASIGIFTIAFPDPYSISYENNQFDTLTSNVSFQYPITSNIQTLSTKNVERGNDPYGILFVPNLQSDLCKKNEGQHVPANATRQSNLPRDTEYALIAFAPWFSVECMLEYFTAARADPAVKAFLVYQPGTSNGMPPIMNDPSWGLGDGGSWKSANNFPTYALSSVTGGIIVDQLSKYSGNITSAPYGHELVSMFGPTDYVRLWSTVNTDSGSQLPSLWVFLVIVLGLLILIIGSTSFCMHIVQRRRRNALRQRVINGEIDLEAIGVKRLTVPREYLEKLPLYTYSAGLKEEGLDKSYPEVPTQTHNIPSPTIETGTGLTSAPLTRRSSAPPLNAPTHGISSAFSQPTCPICLDDFETNESQVRELPCQHIFHADCIDTFLISNSSLCPMCKKSVLPPGYCPATITNLMVRRERNIRRIQARTTHSANGNVTAPPTPVTRPTGAFGSLGNRLGQTAIGRRVFSAPERTQSRPMDIEMAAANPESPPVPNATAVSPSPDIAPVAAQPQPSNAQECTEPATHNRRELARQRAMALLGNRNVPAAGEDEERSDALLRRGLRKVFPGFG